MSKLKAYAELVRLPNLFTAAADILAAYWLCTLRLEFSWRLAAMLAASVSFYAAGIVINDLKDIETDRRERPARPLPSGRVSIGAAKLLAAVLCLVGLVAAAIIPLGYAPEAGISIFHWPNRSLIVAVALLIAIFIYNCVVKETFLGPPVMGLCRALNFTLGLSLAELENPDILGQVGPFIAAYWLYITAVTHFGRDEAGEIRKRRLLTGFLGIFFAVVALGVIISPLSELDAFAMAIWFILLVHLTRVTWHTLRNPSPQRMQYNMKTLILGTLVWNAVIAAAATRDWIAGALLLALLIPTLAIGRRIYST